MSDQPAAERHAYRPGLIGSDDRYCWHVVGTARIPGSGKRGRVACGLSADHPVHQSATSSGDTEPAAPSDCQNQAIGECSPAEPCSPNCPGSSSGQTAEPCGWSHGDPDDPCPECSGQAEHGIDTAAMRAGLHRVCRDGTLNPPCDPCGPILALYDALDARDAEIADQRMVIAHQRDMRHAQQAEIRELQAELGEVQSGADAWFEERQAACAKLEEIRALCRDGSGVWPRIPAERIVAILDRPPHQGAERAEPQA